MNDSTLMQLLGIVAVIFVALGIMIKHDPLWIIRPIWKFCFNKIYWILKAIWGFLAKYLAKLVRWIYAKTKERTLLIWGIVRDEREALSKRIAAGILTILLAIGVVLLWIPAEIAGSGKK